MMAKIKRRPHKIKQKKSIFKNRAFWLVALFLILISALFYFLAFFDKFQISKVVISGNQKVKTENLDRLVHSKIEKKILFMKSQSIFLASPAEISRSILDKYAFIGSAKVKKQYFDTLFVIIEERKPFVILCDKTDDCYFFDETGVAFEKTINTTSEFPIVRQNEQNDVVLGKAAIGGNVMGAIVKIKKNFEEKLNLSLATIDIPDALRLNAKTSEGWQVYFSLENDIDLQITKLNYLLKKELPQEKRGGLQYIDLRFKDRAYYK